jgi:predicted esterase
MDLQHYRADDKWDGKVEPETSPPVGFETVHTSDAGSTRRMSYLALAISGVDRRVAELRVLSKKLKQGPKEKLAVKKKGHRSCLDLDWCCSGEWRTLAIPVKTADAQIGDKLDFTVQIRWDKDKETWDEIGWFEAEVPELGIVSVQHCRFDWRQKKSSNQWLDWLDHVESTPIMEFVADTQVEAAGGIHALRGSQRAFQYATEDVLLSFWMYIPAASVKNEEDKPPLLMFFHGDMARGPLQCPRPGLADFCDVYGPALMVKDPKKEKHPCRQFVVITPCCSDDTWWLRKPGTHDAKDYALSMEIALKEIIQWTYHLGLCDSDRGTCFGGQSMGAYMALEMARAVPEMTQAVVAGAPCFDACRLEHLARRLRNVPVWLLIGRNDTMCSFEEVASLALNMRDVDAKCIRLTSAGIKGHSEVGVKLEHPRIYEWLRDPMDKAWQS